MILQTELAARERAILAERRVADCALVPREAERGPELVAYVMSARSCR